MSIIQKATVTAALIGTMGLGLATLANPTTYSNQSEQGKQSQQQAIKSVAGRVSAIESGGKSSRLAVASENEKTMDFVLDKNTKVQGQVHEGTAVTVEYQATENGQNLAVSIRAEA